MSQFPLIPGHLIRQGHNSGFFCFGQKSIRCFYCSSTIFDLKPEDDPWERHIQLNPFCMNLILHKGEQSIEKYLKEKQGFDLKLDIYEPPEKKFKEEDCIICMDRAAIVRISPCNHQVSCIDCTSKLETCVYCKTKFVNQKIDFAKIIELK